MVVWVSCKMMMMIHNMKDHQGLLHLDMAVVVITDGTAQPAVQDTDEAKAKADHGMKPMTMTQAQMRRDHNLTI